MNLGDASLNSATVRQASLLAVLDLAVQHGFGHVALWRDVYHDIGPVRARKELDTRGLGISSVCRGGMFPQADHSARRRQAADNRAAIDEASTLGARCLVLVCGGVVGKDMAGARDQIREGLLELAPYAAHAGVRLAVEPMHPMMAADRSAITSLGEANDLVELVGTPEVGIALDAYHVWWDVNVEIETSRAGGRIFGVQVSDWILPINDQLASRGMPGEGCIDLAHFLHQVRATGFCDPIEIEVLNAGNWARPAADVARMAARTMSAL
jgi:sugar phosphate isomerase/epimerase